MKNLRRIPIRPIPKITTDILYSTSNQFFITTHSPYVVSDFQRKRDDLAIFLFDYQKGETVMRRLTDEEQLGYIAKG